jgi:hypothetical protein
MMNLKSRWESLADRGKWTARGGTIAAKVKATKAVWFPPTPAKAGKKTASAAKKSTKRATRKTSAAAKKTGASKTARTPTSAKSS